MPLITITQVSVKREIYCKTSAKLTTPNSKNIMVTYQKVNQVIVQSLHAAHTQIWRLYD